MQAALTEAFIKSFALEAGQDRAELSDTRCIGLRLRISATTKTWFYFGAAKGSKPVRVKLGRWPDLGLVAARLAANDMRAKVSGGGVIKRDDGSLTVAQLAERYVAYLKPRRKSAAAQDGLLKRIVADLGERQLRHLERRDVFATLDTIAATAPVSANRTQATLRAMFAYAVEESLMSENILDGAKRRGGAEKAKDRVLDDAEVKALWAALDDVSPSVRLALRTILLTCARPGEVAGMRRDEIHKKDTGFVWLLSGDRTKNGREHVIPLSADALACIREAEAIADKVGGGDYVFCSRYEAAESIARHSLSQAVRRIVSNVEAVKPFTPHDLRRTGATLAREAGAERSWIVALLNHTPPGVTSVYDRYDMLKEKASAVELLAARVRRVVGANADAESAAAEV